MEGIDKIELLKYMLGSGVVSGVTIAILNYLLSKKLKYREAQLKILDKIIDKKIIAYDNILNFVSLTRIVSIYPGETDLNIEFDKFDYPLRFIGVLDSRDVFNEYWSMFVKVSQDNSRWLDIGLIRELNFMQDYLVNLNGMIDNLKLNNEQLRKVGIVLRQDFIDLAYEIEKLCLVFYNKEVTKMKSRNKNQWHKYPREITESRFKETNLYKYKDEIKTI